MATLPEPDTVHVRPSRDDPRARSISSMKKAVPYPVASLRTRAPPHSVPLPVITGDS